MVFPSESRICSCSKVTTVFFATDCAGHHDERQIFNQLSQNQNAELESEASLTGNRTINLAQLSVSQ